MPVQTVTLPSPLPKSHYYLTVTRGAAMRTLAVRCVAVHVASVLLPLFVLIAIGGAAYLVFHDDLVASLMARQGRLQYAYEERISTLRAQMEQQATRHLLDQATVESKVHDLFSREAKLEVRADVVAELAGQTAPGRDNRETTAAAVLGESSMPRARRSRPIESARPAFAIPQAALGYAPAAAEEATPFGIGKPRPEPDGGLGREPSAPSPTARRAPPLDEHAFSLPDRLTVVAASLDRVEQRQVGSLAEIGLAARQQAARLRGALERAGLEPERFAPQAPAGGPYVPLGDVAGSPFGAALAELRDTVATAASLRDAIGSVPLALPLPREAEITSPFGARVDPFLGRPALHAGVDFREDYGTPVQATASGRVASAGTAGGYGNMVEIDHGNGLTTRYAHMEQVLVGEGQVVEKGGVVGRVGATGRATGPHLHYEVRIDGGPVDPVRFITAGKQLAKAELQ